MSTEQGKITIGPWHIIIMAALIVAFCFLQKCTNHEPALSINKNLYDAVTDSLTKRINNLNQEVSEISVMLTDERTAKAVLQLKNDSTNKVNRALASQINKNTLSATAIQTTTTISTSSPTVVSIPEKDSLQPDTFQQEPLTFDSCNSEFPVYTSSYKDSTIEYFILARKDSIFPMFKVTNLQTITQDYVSDMSKGKLLSLVRPKLLKLHVINYNQHTTTDDARSYHFLEVKTRTGLKLVIGAAIGIAAYKILIE